MKFGLACENPAAEVILSTLRQTSLHTVARAVLTSAQADHLLHGLPGVRVSDRWEDLLADTEVQAVLIGGDVPECWEAAKQLASSGMPLIVLPTLSQGANLLYELSLIRDDRQGGLFAFWPQRFDPILLKLKEVLRSEDRPDFSYLSWEQTVAGGVGKTVPRDVINEELFQVAGLLQFLFGTADQVTALQTGGTSTGALIQSVALTGRGIPETSWSIKSAETRSARITLQTADGPWTLIWDEGSSGWRSGGDVPAQILSAAGSEQNREISQSAVTQFLQEVAQAVLDRKGESRWADVLQAAEIVDAAQRSLERRRTIELHHETLSERAIFKTQMAAMGCGVLLLTLVLMLAYLAVASMTPLDPRLLKVLRLVVFAPLFLFLLMQLLMPLTRTSSAEETAKSG